MYLYGVRHQIFASKNFLSFELTSQTMAHLTSLNVLTGHRIKL